MEFKQGEIIYCGHCLKCYKNQAINSIMPHYCLINPKGRYSTIMVVEGQETVEDGPCYDSKDIALVYENDEIKSGCGLWCTEKPEMRKATKKEKELFFAWKV